jgi:hypothetical protein
VKRPQEHLSPDSGPLSELIIQVQTDVEQLQEARTLVLETTISETEKRGIVSQLDRSLLYQTRYLDALRRELEVV